MNQVSTTGCTNQQPSSDIDLTPEQAKKAMLMLAAAVPLTFGQAFTLKTLWNWSVAESLPGSVPISASRAYIALLAFRFVKGVSLNDKPEKTMEQRLADGRKSIISSAAVQLFALTLAGSVRAVASRKRAK